MAEANAPEGGPATLRLAEVAPSAAGRGLGLRGGDVLVAVNGRGFHGDVASLSALAGNGGTALALTFQRGGAEFTVLARTAALGRWESVAALAEDGARRRIDPAVLQPWEMMRAPDGTYDIFPQHLPMLGLALPQLWLLQMRLWVPCAMLVAAVVAGGIVHPALALAVHVAGAAHLRWTHAMYLRLDRRARGLSFHMVLAARGEARAHAAHRALYPDDRYLFARAKTQAAVTA